MRPEDDTCKYCGIYRIQPDGTNEDKSSCVSGDPHTWRSNLEFNAKCRLLQQLATPKDKRYENSAQWDVARIMPQS